MFGFGCCDNSMREIMLLNECRARIILCLFDDVQGSITMAAHANTIADASAAFVESSAEIMSRLAASRRAVHDAVDRAFDRVVREADALMDGRHKALDNQQREFRIAADLLAAGSAVCSTAVASNDPVRLATAFESASRIAGACYHRVPKFWTH